MESVTPEAEWFRHLSEGRFMLQRSRSTGRYVFYPRVIIPGTGEVDLEWVPATGNGTVYSTTIVRKKPPTPSYNVVLIDLVEGPRMMATVVDIDPEEICIGMAVRAQILEMDGAPLLVFVPINEVVE